MTPSKNNFNISVLCYERNQNTLNFFFDVVNNYAKVQKWTDGKEVLFIKTKLADPDLKFILKMRK